MTVCVSHAGPADDGSDGDIVVSGRPEDTVAWLAVFAAVHERRVTRRFLVRSCPVPPAEAGEVVDRALAMLAARDALRRGLIGWRPGPDALGALAELGAAVRGGVSTGRP